MDVNTTTSSSPEAKKDLCIQALKDYINELARKKAEHADLIAHPRDPEKTEAFLMDFSKIMRIFFDNIRGSDEIFALTPWNSVSHVQHNLGGSALYTLLLLNDSDSEEGPMFFESAKYFIEQTIAHIKCILHILEGRKENVQESKSQVIDALRTVVRARILGSPNALRIAGVSDRFELFKDGPLVRTFCDAGLEADIPLHELIEILYVPVSNADRVMGNVRNENKAAPNLRMDVTAREIEHEGVKYLMLECFNTGKLVDLTALHMKIMEMDESIIGAVNSDLLRVIQAIKRGSRQAHLRVDENILIMDGLTLESGGTGIGLADLHRQLELRNGLILLNNVYNPNEQGFCVTILLPQTSGVHTHGLQGKLRRIKNQLTSGKFFFQDVPAEAQVA